MRDGAAGAARARERCPGQATGAGRRPAGPSRSLLLPRDVPLRRCLLQTVDEGGQSHPCSGAQCQRAAPRLAMRHERGISLEAVGVVGTRHARPSRRAPFPAATRRWRWTRDRKAQIPALSPKRKKTRGGVSILAASSPLSACGCLSTVSRCATRSASASCRGASKNPST